MRTFFLFILLDVLFFTNNTLAQSHLKLQDCISIAMENNQIKETQNATETKKLAVRQAKNSYIPTLSISNQHNFSTGRVLDPTTYQFLTNKTVYDMSASVGASVMLFSGFERPRNIKKAKLSLQSALLETEKTKNDIALNVTSIFLEIILDKETIAICENKIESLKKQEELISRKVEYKVATPGDLLNIQADITNANVELTSARNDLYTDKITLCEILEIEDWEQFDIVAEESEYDSIIPRTWSGNDIYILAQELPQIKQGELAVDIAKQDIKLESSSYWPTLSLNAGYGSTYSDARNRPDGSAYNLHDQLKDNMSNYVSVSLTIPILSPSKVSNSVKTKKLAYERAEYELTRTKLALSKEIKQAIINANTSYEKYSLLATDVEKYTEALRQVEMKYDAGAATYYDYQIAVNNLHQAKYNQIRSRFEYIFRTKIIEFYAGKPLT